MKKVEALFDTLAYLTEAGNGSIYNLVRRKNSFER